LTNGIAPFAVPIVGQKIDVFRGYAQATFLCKCHPENKPALIVAIGVFEVCTRCGSVYGIAKIEFDMDKGQTVPLVTVRCFGRQDLTARPPGVPQ
jgi:hypothetical protein